jgi:class 3 adenylate cyclase/tetratricopeptide (TPR) repeat protein
VDIAVWLRELGLERYEPAFRDNEIDAEVLPRLTAEDLTALGVTAVGHRRKLLDAIAALRQADVAPATGTPTNGRSELAPAATPLVLPEGERRQVTVLFADLAGYTALAREVDAEDLHVLLERFFAATDGVIEAHGGIVDKHIGDCVMGVFGAPVAHGNDAERAARAALAIRDAMPGLSEHAARPVAVHIGVASGQVVASGTGGPGHRTYTVTGDSVNLASRLTDLAAPGEVLISEPVRSALAERLECDAAGALEVKGIAEPVPAWRLRGLRATGRLAAEAMVGRKGELRQLEAALAACRASGRGQALYVRGEAGIGKTRLVEEFAHLAADRGFACHIGLVLDFGAGTGRDAIRSLVRSILSLGAGADAVAAADAATRALGTGLVADEDAVFLNDLLDLPQPRELRALYDAMDNAARNRGKRRAVARLTERASREQPLVLLVEDLHWADDLVLAHLARLAVTVAECPGLLVMTSRVEGDPLDSAWRARLGGAPLMTIDLGPLRPEEARLLAGKFLRANAAFAERCVARAAGNPLFLEQLLRHAEDNAEAGVPGSVQNLVQARLDRLEAEDRHALQAASVLGQRFGREALCHLLGQPGYDPARLVRQFLVRPQGEELLFAHALIRDAVYESLLRTRRRELHQRGAEWYRERDPVLSAEHLERAQDSAASRAYLTAARSQAAVYRHEHALRLVERGLALATERSDRFALTCYQGQVLHDLGAMADARGAYEAALAVAADDAEQCQAWLGLGAVKRVTDDLTGAQADLDRAEAAAGTASEAERARIHMLRGNLCFPQGDIQGCLDNQGRALEIARRIGAAELEAAALGGLGDADYVRGRMSSAYARFSGCVAVCREHGFGRIEVANAPMVAITRFYARADVRAALADALAAAEAARRVGHQRGEMVAHMIAAEMHANLCELTAAKVQIAAVEGLAERLGSKRFQSLHLNCQAKVLRAEGRRAEALGLLQRSLAISRETSLGFSGPSVLGALALTTDDAQVRRDAIAEGERLLQAGSVAHNHFRFHRDAIDACLCAEEWDEAERLAAALEDFTRPEPLAWTDFYIARARALAAWGRGPKGAVIRARLEHLAGEARRTGLHLALPALEAALLLAGQREARHARARL